MKLKLKRIVSMLTRMVMKTAAVSEPPAGYHAEIDYDYEDRFAEHEHEGEHRTMGCTQSP